VGYAAAAAQIKWTMEEHFYSRSTGKLKSTSHNSYTVRSQIRKEASSVYSLENEEEDCSQYPTGELSTTQIEYIQAFVDGISLHSSEKIDSTTRAIHWVGSWRMPQSEITVSCSILQPHITLASIGLSQMYAVNANRYATEYSTLNDGDSPKILKTVKYCQVMGKHAIPFVDMLIESKRILRQNVSWNNVVLSLTQPIFCVASDNVVYECKLTHTSCRVMSRTLPESASISVPTSGAHNYTFRCSQLRGGEGTGPSITVHTSGIIQFQGKPHSIKLVTSSFRDCINATMVSNNSMAFLRSLAVLRKFNIL
jgi:hypothetical protein